MATVHKDADDDNIDADDDDFRQAPSDTLIREPDALQAYAMLAYA